MILGAGRDCDKCGDKFGWEYSTPDQSNHYLDVNDDTVVFANAILEDQDKEQFKIEVKCPKCKALNRFTMIAPWHEKK